MRRHSGSGGDERVFRELPGRFGYSGRHGIQTGASVRWQQRFFISGHSWATSGSRRTRVCRWLSISENPSTFAGQERRPRMPIRFIFLAVPVNVPEQ